MGPAAKARFKALETAHPGPVTQAELGLLAELVLALKGLSEKAQAEAAQQVERAEQIHQVPTAVLLEQLLQACVERDALLSVQQQAQQLSVATTHSQGLTERVQR